MCEAEFDRLVVGSLAIDGEVFIRALVIPGINDFDYAYQLIDSALIDIKHEAHPPNGNKIVFGIEYDQYDRPVAYYINENPGPSWNSYETAKSRVRVPAEQIFHLFIPERIGQRRGVPWLATPMQRMAMLDGYEEAAVIAARAGASKALYYTMDDSADPRAAGIATEEDPETGELAESVVPGSASILPPGVSIGAYDPSYPHEQYPEFVKTSLRGIASGLGVSYHKLAGDLSDVNFSAGRMGEFEDRELWKAIQNYLITSWKLPAYEKWLNVMLLSGRITLKNRPTVPLDVNQEMKYQDVAFTGRRWQGIQPKEEALANQINLEMRITSPQRVIQSRGDDPDEILDEWVKWGEKLSNNGLQGEKLPNNGLQSPNDVEVMSDDDEEDDETTE